MGSGRRYAVSFAGLVFTAILGGGGLSAAAQTLTVWAPGIDGTNDAKIWRQIADQFEQQHPGDKVELRLLSTIEGNSLSEKYILGYTGGVGPDVGYMWNEMMPGLVANKMLLPIDSFITPADEERYYDLDYTSFMGHVWGVPLYSGSRILYYNKGLLSEAGVTAPTTWDQFRTAAKKLTRDVNADGNPEIWGFCADYQGTAYGGLNANWDPWLLQAGGSWFSPDRTRVAVNSAAGAEALNFLHALVYEDRSTRLECSNGVFTTGKLAMMIAGIYLSSDIAVNDPDLDFGATASLVNKTQGTWFANDFWGVFSTTKAPKLAWDWLRFSTSGPIMALLHQYIEQLPVARDEKFPNETDVGFQAIAGHMDVMRGRAVIPNGEKVYQAVWDNLRRAMLNQVPVSVALDEAERHGNTFLAEGWKAFGKNV